jgi:hypothetical protein
MGYLKGYKKHDYNLVFNQKKREYGKDNDKDIEDK